MHMIWSNHVRKGPTHVGKRNQHHTNSGLELSLRGLKDKPIISLSIPELPMLTQNWLLPGLSPSPAWGASAQILWAAKSPRRPWFQMSRTCSRAPRWNTCPHPFRECTGTSSRVAGMATPRFGRRCPTWSHCRKFEGWSAAMWWTDGQWLLARQCCLPWSRVEIKWLARAASPTISLEPKRLEKENHVSISALPCFGANISLQQSNMQQIQWSQVYKLLSFCFAFRLGIQNKQTSFLCTTSKREKLLPHLKWLTQHKGSKNSAFFMQGSQCRLSSPKLYTLQTLGTSYGSWWVPAQHLLRIGCCPDCLQVLHEAPVPRSSEPRRVPEGLGFRWAGLVVEHLDGIHVLILSANVLVHHQGWQAWPHHGSAEGAQLDHIAESLRAGLRQCDEPMGNDC